MKNALLYTFGLIFYLFLRTRKETSMSHVAEATIFSSRIHLKPVGRKSIMKKAIALARVMLMTLCFAFALTPLSVLAQSNGSIYAAQGASVPLLFNFSVSGQTFIATILTYGNGGNGRWFAALGSTDGVSGTGQVLSPSGFAFTQPGSMQFQLDQPGAPTGSFTIRGLEAFLPLSSGRFVRIFP